MKLTDSSTARNSEESGHRDTSRWAYAGENTRVEDIMSANSTLIEALFVLGFRACTGVELLQYLTDYPSWTILSVFRGGL